jgi:hypothetical protein
MEINLSDAMVRVIRRAIIHAIKDGRRYEERDCDYVVDLDDAFDLFTELHVNGKQTLSSRGTPQEGH